MPDEKDKERPGPKPDHLKIDGDWEDAMQRAIQKERPKDGWPKVDNESEDEAPAD